MKKINLALTFMFLNVMAFAQEKTGTDINVDINKDGGAAGGGSFPWMWIVGVAVFIIIIFALFSNRGGSDRVVERKTVIKE